MADDSAALATRVPMQGQSKIKIIYQYDRISPKR
jgi:hypothetical protein